MVRKTNRVTVHVTLELDRPWQASFAPDLTTLLHNRLTHLPGINHVKIGHITKVTPRHMEPAKRKNEELP